MDLEPAFFLEPDEHEDGYNQHYGYGEVKAGIVVGKGYDVEIHAEDAAYNGGGCKQGGNHGEELHYLVHLQVDLAHGKILKVHEHIAVVFNEVIGLNDVVEDILIIFFMSLFQEVAFAAEEAVDEIADGLDGAAKDHDLAAENTDLAERTVFLL